MKINIIIHDKVIRKQLNLILKVTKTLFINSKIVLSQNY